MELNQEILQCLQQITQPQTGKPGAMLAALKRLDEIGKSVALPKQLAHYLHNRSYAKALLYLQGEED